MSTPRYLRIALAWIVVCASPILANTEPQWSNCLRAFRPESTARYQFFLLVGTLFDEPTTARSHRDQFVKNLNRWLGQSNAYPRHLAQGSIQIQAIGCDEKLRLNELRGESDRADKQNITIGLEANAVQKSTTTFEITLEYASISLSTHAQRVPSSAADIISGEHAETGPWQVGPSLSLNERVALEQTHVRQLVEAWIEMSLAANFMRDEFSGCSRGQRHCDLRTAYTNAQDLLDGARMALDLVLNSKGPLKRASEAQKLIAAVDRLDKERKQALAELSRRYNN